MRYLSSAYLNKKKPKIIILRSDAAIKYEYGPKPDPGYTWKREEGRVNKLIYKSVIGYCLATERFSLSFRSS